MTLKEQIQRDEGNILHPYLDCCGPKVPWRACPHNFKGHLTMGVGRNLDTRGLKPFESDDWLSHDIDDSYRDLEREYPWASTTLDAVRYKVLVNLVFNMGIVRLSTFVKMLAALRHGDWKAAAAELLDSRYATQVGDRAKRLARQLITGEMQ